MVAQGQSLAVEVGEQKEEQSSLVQQMEVLLHMVAYNMDKPRHYMCLVDRTGVPQVAQDPPQQLHQHVSFPYEPLCDEFEPAHDVQDQYTCGKQTSLREGTSHPHGPYHFLD